jgi:DNA-binding YbaB/EbfC family protein
MAKGFGGMPGGNMQILLQQAQRMQKDMQRAQAEAEAFQAEGTSGGGAVSCVMNGKHEVVAIKLKPEAVDPSDVEMLQDMIRLAVNDAADKIKKNTEAALNKVTGGMNVPGLM